jgi:ATP/maltotriose-dependent transcriptional regulator MalT
MGTLFLYQGRYGAALDAMKQAFETFQELQERSLWSGEVQAAYGNTLALVGHTGEARKHLEESLALALELENPPLIARVRSFQGDIFFYQGELERARNLYQEALETAQDSGDQHVRLATELNLAKVQVSRGNRRAVAARLVTLARQADSLGLKYLSTECSIYRGEALLNAESYSEARQDLDRALRASERLGQKALRARSHFLLAKLQAATGNEAGAGRHYSAAAALLDEMQSEAGSNPLLEREDLAALYAEATRAAGAPRT